MWVRILNNTIDEWKERYLIFNRSGQSLLTPGQVSHVRSKQKAVSTTLETCLHYEYLFNLQFLCKGHLQAMCLFGKYSFGEGNGTPLQYSRLENPMDGGSWWAAVHGVAKESDTTERLHFHFSLSTFLHWRRKWQPTPVFLPGESQGRGSLVGCLLWGHTESDTTEVT